MQRCFVQLSFKGTHYHGWQIQPGAVSVQETLEEALSLILREKISITGAGRTDTGVHASFYIFHFEASGLWTDLDKLVYNLNSFLPADIAIRKIWKVPPEAHARFSAVSRTYQYFVSLQKNPFTTDTEYYLRLVPDVHQMNEAAKTLSYFNDFTSFSRLHTDVKTNLCKIFLAEWTTESHRLIFTIKADRFLRNMVRAIVGTLLDVGKGKLSVDDFQNIIKIKNRGAAGPSAPAHGLFLTHVEYPEHFMNCR